MQRSSSQSTLSVTLLAGKAASFHSGYFGRYSYPYAAAEVTRMKISFKSLWMMRLCPAQEWPELNFQTDR